MQGVDRRGQRQRRGFTLIEVLIAVLLVAVGVTAVFGGIRALNVAQAKAQSADLLQRLAIEKYDELVTVSDPATAETGGDFTDQGYPFITWAITVQQADATGVDQITVKATDQNGYSQSVNGLVYVPDAITTTSTNSNGTNSGTGNGQ